MLSAEASRASCTRLRNSRKPGRAELAVGGYIPDSATYPPSGMALKPNSVSPNFRDHSVGPKPIMKEPTKTPNLRAG